MDDFLFEYGISINFFGNYQKEGKKIKDTITEFSKGFSRLTKESVSRLSSLYSSSRGFMSKVSGVIGTGFKRMSNMADGFTNSLFSLKSLIVGGAFVAALMALKNSIASTGLEMEQNFATLKSTLGATEATLETLRWARIKAAETPFDLPDVNRAIVSMTTAGFNKNSQMRDEVFTAIGDFAAVRGFDFANAMSMVNKATMGNWEQLADNTGLRAATMERMALESKKTAEQKEELVKYAKIVNDQTKKGTEEYRMALVKYLGVMFGGGMEERVKTVGGAISNMSDLVSIFTMELVGYTQVEGSLFNTIAKTLKSKVLDPFDALADANETLKDKLFNIGRNTGNVLTMLWTSVDSFIEKAVGRISDLIIKVDEWFKDFEGNVAPFVIWLTLIKFKIQDFFKGFGEGFKSSFGFMIDLIKVVISVLGKFFGLFTSDKENDIMGIGKAVGFLVGSLLGFKAIRMLATPFIPMITAGKKAISILAKYLRLLKLTAITTKKVYIQQKALSVLMAAKDRLKTFMDMGSAMLKLARGLKLATAAQWLLNIAMDANPIGVVLLIIGLLITAIVYLINHWDEFVEGLKQLPIIGENWDSIVQGLQDKWDAFKNFFIAAWDGMIAAWRDFRRTILRQWEGFKNNLSKFWQDLSGFWNKYFYEPVIVPLKEAFNWLMDVFKKQFPEAYKYISELGNRIWKGITEPIEKAWNMLTGMFGDIYDFFADFSFKKFFDTDAAMSKELKKVSESQKEIAALRKTASIGVATEGDIGYSVRELVTATTETFKEGSDYDKITEAIKERDLEPRTVIENVQIQFPDESDITPEQFLEVINSITKKTGK